MNILVLGGTYFIGRRLVEKLIQDDYNFTMLNIDTKNVFPEISTIRADRRDRNAMRKALENRSFDIIIDISGYTRNDVETVLNCVDSNKIKQYIFCSSAAVYSRPPQYWPMTEEHPKCFSKENGEYGYNKLMAEQLLFRKWKEENLNISIVRPTYVYGPYDYSRRISYIFEKIKGGKPVLIPGNGENIIQLGYVDDLADAIISILGNAKAYGEAFNISGAELVTIQQLVKIAADALKMKVDIRCLNDESNIDKESCSLPDFHYLVDIRKAKEILDISPKTNLVEGMRRTALWWLENKGGN
jgi:nucleoside-diphosphate-sugar epimerase